MVARKAMGAARRGRRASTRSTARGVQRATPGAASSSDLIPAGVLNLVGDTIVTARAGVHDVGADSVRRGGGRGARLDQSRLSDRRRSRLSGSRGGPLPLEPTLAMRRTRT